MNENFRKIVFAALLVLLFVPCLYRYLIEEDFYKLNGDVIYVEDITCDQEKWFSSEYQEKKEKYVSEQFGLRSWFVRLNNQITFSFFKKAKASGVIIGKENYLYELPYIKAYNGEDYLGDAKIDTLVKRMTAISRHLDSLNKKLVVVLAPGKASFYPEYIPDKYRRPSEKTNYHQIANKTHHLNVVDFQRWFIQNKYKSKYPLYPQYGIHWSQYGMALAADSLIKYITHVTQKKIPQLKISSISVGPASEGELDIENGMNLLFSLKTFPMATANVDCERKEGKDSLNTIVISDSFFWGMYVSGFSNSFNRLHFWYYNKEVFSGSSQISTFTSDLDVENEINNHDIVIIMCTEANLSKIGWGFIENFNSPVNLVKTAKIKEMELAIRQNKEWMEGLEKRSEQTGVPVERLLHADAVWQIERSEKK